VENLKNTKFYNNKTESSFTYETNPQPSNNHQKNLLNDQIEEVKFSTKETNIMTQPLKYNNINSTLSENNIDKKKDDKKFIGKLKSFISSFSLLPKNKNTNTLFNSTLPCNKKEFFFYIFKLHLRSKI
jgi:transcriptional/translational regulatory protein YebC/TACO1